MAPDRRDLAGSLRVLALEVTDESIEALDGGGWRAFAPRLPFFGGWYAIRRAEYEDRVRGEINRLRGAINNLLAGIQAR
jgi:hypothetical protein